jgi:hypothetical protein
MPLNPGDILFTSILTDPDPGVALSDAFSIVATTSISAGEVITFHGPEASTNATFSYTVGPDGLDPGDRVTFQEISNSVNVLHDPSYASSTLPTGLSVTGTGSWTIAEEDSLVAGSNGEAIAAINMENPWDTDFSSTGLGRTLIDAAILSNTPSPVVENLTLASNNFGNAMFSGTNINGINDPSNWSFNLGGQDHSNPVVDGTTYASQDSNIVVCFAKGTLIATPSGEKTVETLCIGDRIVCSDGREVPVKWIGRQTVSTRFGPAERLMLVRFAAGSLGDGLPQSDLTVTVDHGMLVDGVICHAGALVNGTTISRVPLAEMGETYTVYHIETEAHEIILANGAPAETFIDNVSRRVFDNYAEFETLYGDVPEMEELPYPRAMSARQVPVRILNALDTPRCA